MSHSAQVIDIHEAEAHLAQLVDRASEGESFTIEKAGKPLAKVIPFKFTSNEIVSPQRIGFMKGKIIVPDDFDQMGRSDIEGLFGESA